MKRQKIQLLPDEVINQIAAGEVVERPASAVKELVENSLDAGASDIRILIEGGGKTLIRVADDGCGMSAEDLEMCLKRHATSKITQTKDLLRLMTNGFRGEAVASIAAVSKLMVESRVAEDETGTRLECEGERVVSRTTVARPVGTLFQVKDLFWNTPVRRNFLGSASLETSRIVDVVSRLALANPQVRFELRQGSRDLLIAARGSEESRLSDILGASVARRMVPFAHGRDGMLVRGYAAPPEDAKGRRQAQYVYVGKRPIWNPVISRAIQRAYEPFGVTGYPVVVLFLELDGHIFDVNVHPTKREVRFADEQQIFQLVQNALRETWLKQGGPVIRFAAEFGGERVSAGENSASDSATRERPVGRSPETEPVMVVSQGKVPAWTARSGESDGVQDLFSLPEYGKVVQISSKLFRKGADAGTVQDARARGGGRFFQWAATYVICEDSQGLVVMDQNAAHQRILYEEALRALRGGHVLDAQELLFPEVVDLSVAEAETLRVYGDRLGRLGFHLEPFGGNTWQLRGIPAHVSVGRAEAALRRFLQELGEDSAGESPEESVARAFACGAALQAGVVLNAEEMAGLFEQLVATAEPYLSPGGRPTLLRLPLSDMHRRFGRAD